MKHSATRCNDMNLAHMSWLSLLNYIRELSKTKIPSAEIIKVLFICSKIIFNEKGIYKMSEK